MIKLRWLVVPFFCAVALALLVPEPALVRGTNLSPAGKLLTSFYIAQATFSAIAMGVQVGLHLSRRINKR